MESALDDAIEPVPATEGILAFIGAALARFPELDDSSGCPECPWATSPLAGEAVGDLIYFSMTFSGAQYARDPLAEIADSLGLVCLDPQLEVLLPDEDATPGEQEAAPTQRGWLGRLFRKN